MDPADVNETRMQQVLHALQGRPEGATREEIEALAGLGMANAQSVRRLLARMVARGQVRAEGSTRGRRYLLARAGQVPAGPASLDPSSYPDLSPEGLVCREDLAQPLYRRQPVSYQRAFLDAYRPNETFYLTGQNRSDLAQLGRTPGQERPAGTYARQRFQRLLVDLSWNSSRLEGNTYSLLDTEKLFELGEAARGKDRQETQMILNHKAAIEFLVESAEEIAPDPSTVRNLHALLAEDLLANPMEAGCLRSMPVGIHGTTYLPTAVPQLVEECFRQILLTATEIEDPFEQSFFLLVHLPYLQPFVDGNKRTARLAANIPLVRLNCIPITFMDVPATAFMDGLLAIYEQNQVAHLRDVYLFAYARSCARFGAVKASFGEPDPFRLRYRAELKAIVRAVVLAGESIPEAQPRIRAYAQAELPREAWTRFLSVVETELASMHDGNFARFQLRPSQYQAWKARTQG